MLVIVARYTDPLEAQIARGRLAAEGIETHLGDEHSAIGNWEWRLAIGGVKLRVPEEQQAHARRILQALDDGAYALDDEAQPLADGCVRSAEYETRSSRLAWIALMLFNLPLPWRRAGGGRERAARRV